MRKATHLFKHLVMAYQKQQLEQSYQRSLQLHLLKDRFAALEKRLEELKQEQVDDFKVKMLKERIDSIKHLFP